MTERNAAVRKLAALIEDVEIAMFTTHAADGRLVSRPLGTQQVEFDGDLWFATAADSAKAREIADDPRVNVAYASRGKNVYVSVSGTASLVDDRAKIDEIWSPAMKLFFPGGKDDPQLRLIRVAVDTAEYWDGPGTLVGNALNFLISAVSNDPTDLSEHETLHLGHR
ncbi:general stress protein [Lysobacter sp. Root667]|uniref:pyridoxamine 5'-phosphate oxidase family protein n=1 Tax=Lysobacter sp. Root667 TaxID=1736581 RepID=UPI0006F7B355|nr:pyridoxamine 5'-phosphate oxidase family protein [Lysobacter sp. Root667]KRA74160.1 general stress protein [Lysobacter sp. Root667]